MYLTISTLRIRSFSKFCLVILLLITQISAVTSSVHAQDEVETDEVHVPVTLPEWSPPTQVDGVQASQLVAYDVETKTERLITTNSPVQASSLPSADSVPGGEAIDDAIQQEPDIVAASFNNLSLVDDPDNHPWRMNVKLFVYYDEAPNLVYHCSGVLIDPQHVLTAGHCIFDHENGWGWADEIRVVPGYDNGTETYGDANMATAPSLYSWRGWTVSEDYNWDMGYIKLDKPIGALTSWFGYGYDDNNSFFKNNYFHNPGYPAASPYNGQLMYYWYGTYDSVRTHILYHKDRSYGGQSGSGSYYIDRSDSQNYRRYVYSVLSHAPAGKPNETGQTRINADRFNSIRDQITANTPKQFDLIPMDVNIGPSYTTAGNRLSSMNFLLHNYSSQNWSGTASIKIYLSTNDNISTADTLLTTTTLNTSLTAKHSTRVTISVPPVIPSSVSGNYWVGVIVDTADFNIGNNDTDGWDAASLYVLPRVQAAGDDEIGQTVQEEQTVAPEDTDFQIFLPVVQQ